VRWANIQKMSKQQYLKELLNNLTKICKNDPDILCLFIHGSIVYKTVATKNYTEIMLLEGKTPLGSIFRLQKLNPDIDMVCISNNPEKTHDLFVEHFKRVDNFFLTANIMSPKTFKREASSLEPTAIKRILAKRKLFVVKNWDLLSTMKKIAKKNLTKVDINFQKEYQFRKEFLKLHIRNNVDSFILSIREYERLFPLYAKFERGEIFAGFPPDRIKLVLPRPMNLKAKLDIVNYTIKYLE
jgi:hypothetical protein